MALKLDLLTVSVYCLHWEMFLSLVLISCLSVLYWVMLYYCPFCKLTKMLASLLVFPLKLIKCQTNAKINLDALFSCGPNCISAHYLWLGRKQWMVGSLGCEDALALWKLAALLMVLGIMLWQGKLQVKFLYLRSCLFTFCNNISCLVANTDE